MNFTNEVVMQNNLYERVSQLLESFEWSDCTFIISGRIFKAHKLLLGISSPVFKAMFYGPMSTEDEVIICDIEPNTFQLLLNYIYTDKIDIISVEQAFELLYSAKKYMLEYLAEKCKEYIAGNISVDNVILVLNYSDYVQEKQLFNQALAIFCARSNYLFENGIENMSVACLKALLECDQVNTIEYALIKAIFKWSTHFCTCIGISTITENKRRVLVDNGLFQLLRFFVLSNEQLETLILEENLLLPEEVELIKNKTMKKRSLEYKTEEVRNKNDILCLDIKPRKSLKFTWYYCHRSALRASAPLRVDENCNSVHIRMRSSKTVFINSLGVKTRTMSHFWKDNIVLYSENFSVKITQESNNSIIKGTNFMSAVEHDSLIFVNFAEPCAINKDVWYIISFTWPIIDHHMVHRYVVCHRNQICNHKVKFEFEDMIENSNNCGSFLEGLKYSF